MINKRNPRAESAGEFPSSILSIILWYYENENRIGNGCESRGESGGEYPQGGAEAITTKPVDCIPGTPDFINTAVIGQWEGTPLELLAVCQRIEREAGRPAVHSSREARLLDIDVLLWGTETLSLPNLIVPHPRMHLRRFVLEPLAAIAPDWIVPPFNKTVAQLLKNL